MIGSASRRNPAAYSDTVARWQRAFGSPHQLQRVCHFSLPSPARAEAGVLPQRFIGCPCALPSPQPRSSRVSSTRFHSSPGLERASATTRAVAPQHRTRDVGRSAGYEYPGVRGRRLDRRRRRLLALHAPLLTGASRGRHSPPVVPSLPQVVAAAPQRFPPSQGVLVRRRVVRSATFGAFRNAVPAPCFVRFRWKTLPASALFPGGGWSGFVLPARSYTGADRRLVARHRSGNEESRPAGVKAE